MKKLISAFAACLILACNTTNAQWIEATGQAPLLNEDLESARQLAVQNALKQALLFSGAQVKSIAKMSNGLLTSDRFEIQSHGSVRELQLLSETHTDNQVTVTISADIFAQDKRCSIGNTINKIALTKFPIRHRHQATNGGLFDLGKQTSQQLFSILEQHHGSFKATALLDIEQEITAHASVSQQSPTPVQVLAQSADVQYVLSGEIIDLSLHNPTSKWLGLASNDPIRQYELSLTLFNALDSTQVWRKTYTAQGSWDLPRTKTIDVSSSKFWNTPYGAAISAQLRTVAHDLNETLYCAELSGSVINVDNNKLTINLGSSHGIKVGDKFSVHHSKQFVDNNGISRQSLVLNPATLIVQQANANHSVVTTGEATFYGDITLNDIVKKQ